jgi:hypothetical protein
MIPNFLGPEFGSPWYIECAKNADRYPSSIVDEMFSCQTPLKLRSKAQPGNDPTNAATNYSRHHSYLKHWMKNFNQKYIFKMISFIKVQFKTICLYL